MAAWTACLTFISEKISWCKMTAACTACREVHDKKTITGQTPQTVMQEQTGLDCLTDENLLFLTISTTFPTEKIPSLSWT